jgi:hypothetical protein
MVHATALQPLTINVLNESMKPSGSKLVQALLASALEKDERRLCAPNRYFRPGYMVAMVSAGNGCMIMYLHHTV